MVKARMTLFYSQLILALCRASYIYIIYLQLNRDHLPVMYCCLWVTARTWNHWYIQVISTI